MTALTRSDFGQQYLVRMDAFVLLKKMIIINTDRATLIRITTEFIELLLAQKYSRAGHLLNVMVPPGGPHNDAAQAGFHIRLQALQEDAIT